MVYKNISFAKKEPSAKGVTLDAVLGLAYMPAFCFAYVAAEHIVSSFVST